MGHPVSDVSKVAVQPARCRIFTSRVAPAPPELIDELRTFELACLADASGCGVMDEGIRPAHGYLPRFVGPAVTVKTAPNDFKMIPWAVDRLEAGDVLVVDGSGGTSMGIWGDVVSTRAKELGCVGVVIDGAARDADGIEELKLPVLARGLTNRGPTRQGPGDVNVPVSCGGVSVLPGDIVVADKSGVLVIPRADLATAVAKTREKAAADAALHHSLRQGGWPAYLDRHAQRYTRPDVLDRAWNE